MKTSTLGIFLLLLAGFPNTASAQPFPMAVNDTLCVMLGNSFHYNVKDNDLPPHASVPVFLSPAGSSPCIGLTQQGELFFLPSANADCCGLQILKYRYEGCQPGQPGCEGVIYFTIKCPKPDCALVNLEDFAGGGGAAGLTTCASACEHSTATYYVPFNPLSTYSWQVTGDISTAAGANPAEIIVTWGPAGAGAITLTTTNPNRVITICVDILPGPTASFTVSDSFICCGNSVNFLNTSLGADGWFWDFGDGSTSNMFSPAHAFTTPGTYTVCLHVTKNNYDAMGNALCSCTDSTCVNIVVDPLKGPQIYCVSTLCAFDSSQYWTNATNCSSYVWTVLDANGIPLTFAGQGTDTISVDWGDGPQGTVSLAVLGCDSAFCDDPTSVIVPIIPSTVLINGLTVVCQLASATYTVPKWLSTYYDWQVTGGTITSGQGTNTITIHWGPGPTGTISLHYYSNFLGGLPGEDPDNCMGLANLTVNIKPEFSLNGPPTACLNTMSGFNANPAGTYTWTIVPAAPFTGQGTGSITATWNTGPGTYVVTAVPTNPTAFCNAAASTVIQVLEQLPADSIDGPVQICPGQTYTYHGLTSQTGVGFLWTVVGGTPASFTGNPVTVTWNAVGPYSLSLQLFGTNPPSCSSVPISITVTPKVLNGPLTITGSLTSCINGSQNYAAGPAQHPDATYTWTITPASAGSVAAGQGTPNITVQWNNTPGPAVLTLTVSLCNSTLTKSVTVAVQSAPPPTITQNGILCPGLSATLNAGPGYSNYAWSSGPNGPGFQMITISSGGTYTVTVTDGFGCTATDSYQAIPLPAPVADISTGDPTMLCINPPAPATVTIYAQTHPNYTFKWYCNGTLQLLPPAQAFFVHNNTSMVGAYLYSVIVTDSIGCKDTSNVIVVTQDSCIANGQGGCVPGPYTLNITSMNQTPNCDNVAFTVTSSNATLTGWNFGDPNGNANTGTLANAAHVYSKAGCFLATLSATVPGSPNGPCTVIETESVCVPLVANFSFSVNCLKVTFTNLTTLLPATGPITWLWNFGDSFTSTQENPMHTYAMGGTYMVKLTATNPAGCVSMITLPVFVAGPPTATISVDMDPCVNEAIQFLGIGAGITSWFWDFGDTATNALQNPFHAYTSPGIRPVILIVQDAQGCADTVMTSVNVHAAPPPDTIAFTPGLTICAGGTVTLTAPGGPYTWQWSASAGGATTQVVTVTAAGTYSVTITDVNGCTMVPDSVTVVVNPLPSAIISGNPFICDAGCTTLGVSGGFNYSYQWLNNTLTPLVPVQTGQTLQVCAGNLLPGGYAVMVTDPNGCTAVSPVTVVQLAISPVFTVTVMPDSCAGTPAILTVVPVQPNVVYSWNNGGTGPTITVVQAGVYNVVGTDTLTGCQGFGSQIIYPLPDLCIVPVGCYEICNPDTICGPDSLAAYQWNLNGVAIPGATDQCLIVTQSGTYTLTGTTAFGCSLTSDSLMLMIVNCACDQLNVSAQPSTEDSCCWILSYNNQFGDLYGVVIHSDDTGFNFSGLSDSLQIFSIGANTISLVNSQPGAPLPSGVLDSFLIACLQDVVHAPQQIVIDWYDFDYQVACSDTLIFDCPVEPDCMYVQADTIYCDGESVHYTITVCNPVDNDFEVGYIVLMPSSPAGIVVTPPNVLVNPPMVPGECRDFTFVLTGPSLEGETFCFSLTAHDTVPGLIDTTHCCMLDTMYCVPIPDCMPCDDIGVEDIVSTPSPGGGDYCCYKLSLYNNYAANFFDGINLCLLSPATAMTINNPFGSGWSTASYSPTMIQLDVVPPLGSSLPLGIVTLPTICIERAANPYQQVEIKWMQGDSVLCRDTVLLFCDPDCGYLLDDVVVCNDSGYWNYSGMIMNTSGFTMGEAHFVFTSPAGLGIFNQTIVFPGGLPSGGSYPFNLILDVPAMSGDTVCFTVALHQLNDDAMHIHCCNFYDCIVLPECAVEEHCFCDEAFQDATQHGILCTILAVPPHTATFAPAGMLASCDQVVWFWSDTPQTDTTYGNASITHTFSGFGSFKMCMLVHREDVLNQTSCEFETCKEVVFLATSHQYAGKLDISPNPSPGSFTVTTNEAWPAAVQLRVFNPYGQMIREWTEADAAGTFRIPVELGDIEAGVYLLELRSEGERWVRKVMIR